MVDLRDGDKTVEERELGEKERRRDRRTKS